MKRVLPIVIIAAAVALFLTKTMWLPAGERGGRYLGYVEGETTLIAPPVAGRLVARPVARGETVAKDAVVFSLDPTAADADVARSRALLAEAKARLDDLKTGKREAEQDIVRAQRREAEAQLRFAEQDLSRAAPLAAAGFASRARYDQAASQVAQMRARVAQMTAQETAGDLGGRRAEREAADAKVGEAEAGLAQAARRRADLTPVAPESALVENTFFEVGEWVGAGQPVVSLLAADKVKLRFFVPEEDAARAAPGASIRFSCDGCPPNLEAVIAYVAPRAEFTPPVIYSENARKKLSFLVEARPLGAAGFLRIGLPIDVRALDGGAP